MREACDRAGCAELGCHAVQLLLPGERHPVFGRLCTDHRAEAHRLGVLVDRWTRRVIPPDQPIPGDRPPKPLRLLEVEASAPDPAPEPHPPQPEEPMQSASRQRPDRSWTDIILHDVLAHPGTTARELAERTHASNPHSYLRQLCARGQLTRAPERPGGVLRYWPPDQAPAGETPEAPIDPVVAPAALAAPSVVDVDPDDTTVEQSPAEVEAEPTAGSFGEDEECAPTTPGRGAVYAQAVAALQDELDELDAEHQAVDARIDALSQRLSVLQHRRAAVAETLGMLRSLAEATAHLRERSGSSASSGESRCPVGECLRARFGGVPRG